MMGISFNGKHSYKDFDVTLAPGKQIGIPDKEKITVKVPFSNEEYDFSELYGSQTYSPRTLTYKFNLFDDNKVKMTNRKVEFVNWIMNSKGKQPLFDDALPGYYFLAEVEGNISFSEEHRTGVLTVTFKAYPFMISEHPEGSDIWDTFNFVLDVSQEVDFTVNGSLSVTLLNVGTPDVVPEVNTSSPMTISKTGTIYSIPTGVTKSNDFILKSGENVLTVTGNGTISFKFHKELI